MKIKCNLKIMLITERADMQQKEFAAELEMNYNHFNRIVNGKVIPTLPIALKIAKHMGKHVMRYGKFEQKKRKPGAICRALKPLL